MSAPLGFCNGGLLDLSAGPEANMSKLEFICVLYVALCVGATIGYVLAALLNDGRRP